MTIIAFRRPPRGAALRAGKGAATAYAAAAGIRGLTVPSMWGDAVPPDPPAQMGKCNCRRWVNVVDAGHMTVHKRNGCATYMWGKVSHKPARFAQ